MKDNSFDESFTLEKMNSNKQLPETENAFLKKPYSSQCFAYCLVLQAPR